MRALRGAAAAILIVTAGAEPFAGPRQDDRRRTAVHKADTPHLTLIASAGSTSCHPGARVSLFVDVAPKARMHVYAPGQKEYIPVSLSLASDEAFKIHPPVFPAAEKYFFEPLKETQLVYSKPFRIVQDLTIAQTAALRERARASGAALTISGSLRYQACDDRVCYMPRTVPVSWTIALKPVEE